MSLFRIHTDECTVPRFDRTDRLLHWLNALFYIILMMTGFAFAFPMFGMLSLGHPIIMLVAHVVLGIGLALLLIFLYLTRKRQGPLLDWRAHFSYLRSNKYNVGQKLNITMTTLFLTVFLISGLLLLTARFLPVPIVKIAFYVHNLGVLLMLPLILGHIFLSLVFPATNRSLFAMIVGKVDELYARRHHPEWFTEVTGCPPAGRRDTTVENRTKP